MSKEAMKLALEALESCGAGHISDGGNQWHDEKLVDKAITALREALAEQPARPYRQLQDNGSKYFGESWDKAEQPAQQEPVAWPAGLIERITAAEQRIQDGHAPRRIPADPTDVDLVLAEVRYLLEGKQPPFWVSTSPPAQRKPLTDVQKDAARYQYLKTMARAMSVRIDGNHAWRMNLVGIFGPSLDEAIDRAIEAAHGIKENT